METLEDLELKIVELCCDIADSMLNLDGYPIQLVTDEHGNESYSEKDQDRFNLIYGAVMELIENAREVAK